ncbi:hypothetical protein TIFTF001_031618 [Ficus carica]|uniref:Ubiquitin-like protease family profile domain-containing protein n=1 Tax=Ficus carica TaxID=3494 RepID=A0AA88J5Q5_FICCA|nr:hypothetical protein TIFTF001_031618 [Ficus carica]
MSFNKQEETCSCTQRRSSTNYVMTCYAMFSEMPCFQEGHVMVSNLPAISDAILWRAGAADCEIMKDEVYVCMASKLPLVVPIHISSDLVYNMIMMAFKEGLKVRYSSDDPAWEVGALQPVWLWDEHIDVVFYYMRQKIRQYPDLAQRKVTTIDTYFLQRIMLGVRVQSGASWFDLNTVLIPIHLEDLKHWALAKLDLTNWTIEVYDSLQHEGPHNSKVRAGVEGTYPIPVSIMKDIPQQANGGDCEMFTIKFAECLIEGRDVRY